MISKVILSASHEVDKPQEGTYAKLQRSSSADQPNAEPAHALLAMSSIMCLSLMRAVATSWITHTGGAWGQAHWNRCQETFQVAQLDTLESSSSQYTHSTSLVIKRNHGRSALPGDALQIAGGYAQVHCP